MKSKNILLLSAICLLSFQFLKGQGNQNFLYTKGDNNISTITMGFKNAPHCTVVEYPDFLVVHEIPAISFERSKQDSSKTEADSNNPLISFIDSVYLHKPIRYVLNSHHHSHSLSAITPFLEKGAKLVTAKENLMVYDKRSLFGNKMSKDFSESIVLISSDTVLLADSGSPIEVLYLKKSDYKSIPTKTFLFFNFTKQNVLATSCMVYLRDIDEKYGYKGIVYNDRLIDVNKIIADKKLVVENTLQLYKFRSEDGVRKLPVFPIAYHENVLKNSWHRLGLSEHFQNMSYEELTVKKDSLLDYLIESDVYHIVLNHAVYQLIEKKEYQKAVAVAQILVTYEPNRIDEIDTLGEAYFNNGQVAVAKHYDSILRSSKEDTTGLGIAEWETNQKKRLKNGS